MKDIEHRMAERESKVLAIAKKLAHADTHNKILKQQNESLQAEVHELKAMLAHNDNMFREYKR